MSPNVLQYLELPIIFTDITHCNQDFQPFFQILPSWPVRTIQPRTRVLEVDYVERRD
jgi:hypothetical protein